MNKLEATSIFETLASSLRMDIYRLLIKKGKTGMVAGEIASTLQLAPTNLSFHLKALTRTGLLNVEQEGRFLRYRANIAQIQDLISFLTENCCENQPEQCMETDPVFRYAASNTRGIPASGKTD
jgi:ArsR family transcriptional regulator, arsenate/arsenite/antimonite-responsive transcriptional repressor